MTKSTEFATFAGGCFWCIEAVFKRLKGIISVQSGYAGGHACNPSYEEVCSGQTGHAEVIQIEFDPKLISYQNLLGVFFTSHDPTTLNRQGNDIGTQYRSAVFYHNECQHQQAKQFIADHQNDFDAPIVTEVAPLSNYHAAEQYHQDYYANNPEQAYCNAVIPPKLSKLRKEWQHLIK